MGHQLGDVLRETTTPILSHPLRCLFTISPDDQTETGSLSPATRVALAVEAVVTAAHAGNGGRDQELCETARQSHPR